MPTTFTFDVECDQCDATGSFDFVPHNFDSNFTGSKAELPGTPIAGVAGMTGVCAKCGQGQLRMVGQIFFLENGQIIDMNYYKDLEDKWHIIFLACHVHTQEFGTENEHMQATIHFMLLSGQDWAQGEVTKYECSVIQPSGEQFAFNTTPVEVHLPDGLRRRVNYSQFRDEVEKYYRASAGIGGASRLIAGNAPEKAFLNNVFMSSEHHVFIDKAEDSFGTW